MGSPVEVGVLPPLLGFKPMGVVNVPSPQTLPKWGPLPWSGHAQAAPDRTHWERVERAFQLVRDLLVFTNRRFILIDRLSNATVGAADLCS